MKINEIYYKNLLDDLSDCLSDDEKLVLFDLVDNDFYANVEIDWEDEDTTDWEFEVDSYEE